MSIIQILDSITINHIAAGEVVERPMSVVKELVENSIDAESTAITIEISEGGISYIRVTDNGLGIDQEDAAKAFERHATSKISNFNDLNHITSLGFRGEALASIASVSQVEMITRTPNSLSGISIIYHGGNLMEINETGCPEGTTLLVRNLFYNAPARIKFLKKSGMEAAYISDIIIRFILSNPSVSIKFINNGKMIYHSIGDGELCSAIYSVYGKEIIAHLIKMNAVFHDVHVWGYIGTAEISRSNRNYQSLFINGRYVKNKEIVKAIELAYHSVLPINQFPFYVLHMSIPTNHLDVNVHPNKTEVRLFHEREIVDGLVQNVRDAILQIRFIPKQIEDQEINDSSPSYVKASNDVHDKVKENENVYDQVKETNYGNQNQINYIDISSHVKQEMQMILHDDEIVEGMELDKIANNNNIFDLNSIKIIGQLFNTYIIVEQYDIVYIIDQHAAHERLLYEKYKQELEKGEIVLQQLLIPYTIEVTYSEKEYIIANMALLHKMGYILEEFGILTYQLRAIPNIFGASQIKDNLLTIIDSLYLLKPILDNEKKQDLLMQMACKHAIKAGDPLQVMEISWLLECIKQDKIPLTCPHGRPILTKIYKHDLEKRFKRT